MTGSVYNSRETMGRSMRRTYSLRSGRNRKVRCSPVTVEGRLRSVAYYRPQEGSREYGLLPGSGCGRSRRLSGHWLWREGLDSYRSNAVSVHVLDYEAPRFVVECVSLVWNLLQSR